jgi:hypothetical protein
MAGRSAPLGVPGPGGRRQAAFTLAPGEGLLLYTDGLIERRGEAIDVAIERLLGVVGDRPGASPSALVRALPEVLLEQGAGGDDVCLLALRRAAAA